MSRHFNIFNEFSCQTHYRALVSVRIDSHCILFISRYYHFSALFYTGETEPRDLELQPLFNK